MLTWTLDRVALALAGELRSVAAPSGTAPIGSVSTDTRTIAPGDVFVALRGDRFDGHDFLGQAASRRAAALVVDDATRAAGLGLPAFVVHDTTSALGALGAWWRATWGGTAVAIAGSNGKTTTKELVRAALGGVLDVVATTGNLNNQVGVPLSLLRIPSSASVAVIEVGTSEPGEVALLRAIVQPDISVVTSIGEEHLEGLGSLAGVLREEAAIYDAAGLGIAPAAPPELAEAARARAHHVVVAGLDEGDVRPTGWGMGEDGRGWAMFGEHRLTMRIPGVHNLRNAMLAMAVARACGVPDGMAVEGMSALEPLDMRGRWLTAGSLTIINDAYNANPASMREAIALLASLPPDRPRVIVLGTMRELGAQAPSLHEEIAARALASGADLVAGVGDFADPMRAHGRADRVVTAPDVPGLWALLKDRLPANSVVLLKASRGVQLERLVPWLQEWAADRAPASRLSTPA